MRCVILPFVFAGCPPSVQFELSRMSCLWRRVHPSVCVCRVQFFVFDFFIVIIIIVRLFVFHNNLILLVILFIYFLNHQT